MSFSAVDPTTGVSLYSVPSLDASARDALLQRVHTEQQAWRSTSIAQRAQFIVTLGEALTRHREALARALTDEMGKPITSARAEVDKCALLCTQAPTMAFLALAPETLVDDSDALVTMRYEPLGVILAIMPWNFPYWQALRFAVPALLAGNGVLIKPAPSVPASARVLQLCLDEAARDAARQAGRAPCHVALFDVDDIDAVIADARIAGVTLTGSDRAGRHVAEVAGRHLKKVVLELGGSDPFIVLDDADIARAASVAVSARTVNSGQSCIAAKRFIVCDAVYDEFLARFTSGMASLVMGNPRDEHTQIGPIATASVRDSLARQVRESVARGARVVLGGDATGLAGFFYPPTILADVPADSPAACEELFGPVATVFRVANRDEAIALANATPYGLGSSVWTRDAANAEACIAALDCGMVFINDMVVSDARYPFGGVKQSGLGRELGPVGFREFTNQKSVRIRRPPTDPR